MILVALVAGMLQLVAEAAVAAMVAVMSMKQRRIRNNSKVVISSFRHRQVLLLSRKLVRVVLRRWFSPCQRRFCQGMVLM
jgi:hypothetical protein